MEIKAPELGEGVDSASVVQLLVEEGDSVKEGDDLIEVESDKAVSGLPSTASGKVVKLHVKEGDDISPGDLVATLEQGESDDDADNEETQEKSDDTSDSDEEEKDSDDSDEADDDSSQESNSKPENKNESKPVKTGETHEDQEESRRATLAAPASPSVRKLALQLGIDLTRVAGSERGGRIGVDDLRGYIESLQRIAFEEKSAPPQEDLSQWGPIQSEPLSAKRRTIAKRLGERWSRIPLVTQFDEADLSSVLSLKKQLGDDYEEKNVHLTVTAFLIKALVASLKKYPIFNAALDSAAGKVIHRDYVHLAVAVDTENGLLAPVIRDVNKKSLLDLSRELAEISEEARSGSLDAGRLKGASFTLSNQGGIGGGSFTPLLSGSASAILGVGAPRQLAAPGENGQVVFKPSAPLCLSYDHRLIDGAAAARFIDDLRGNIENFGDAKDETDEDQG